MQGERPENKRTAIIFLISGQAHTASTSWILHRQRRETVIRQGLCHCCGSYEEGVESSVNWASSASFRRWDAKKQLLWKPTRVATGQQGYRVCRRATTVSHTATFWDPHRYCLSCLCAQAYFWNRTGARGWTVCIWQAKSYKVLHRLCRASTH
jgi:hypothetical protein